jgi:phospholipid-binding lipoprotein MlaA
VKIFIDKIKILNIIIIIALSNFIILQNSYSFSDDKLYTDSDFEDYGDFNFDLKREHTEVYDPLEPVNRIIYKFNDVTDRYFFEHIARGYQKSIPKKARISIRNFISNLASPFTIFNSILQGSAENTMSSFSAFLINSTIGLLGFIDVASAKDIDYNKEDFGQTLASYGVGPGPYLVIPFLGPSNLRDFTGFAARIAFDVISIESVTVNGDNLVSDDAFLALTVISLIDKREGLLNMVSGLRENSFDPYATARSAFMQNRNAKINNK